VSLSSRVFVLFAVVGAPLAWMGQLTVGYAFEDVGCAPPDGLAVWNVGVGSLHVVVGVVALVVALASLACAVVLRLDAEGVGLAGFDRTFLGTFGVLFGYLFGLTIVLTAIGSIVLGTCRPG
jgi:hypothetical protein